MLEEYDIDGYNDESCEFSTKLHPSFINCVETSSLPEGMMSKYWHYQSPLSNFEEFQLDKCGENQTKLANLIVELRRCKQMISNSLSRKPHFACFGLHEWAMVYSGSHQDQSLNSQDMDIRKPANKKQEKLPFRVSQSIIDKTVEENTLRCTHFDAFRFFHNDAKIRNIIPNLNRGVQVDYEQPGCLHHTMDLFRFAYLAYPLLPAPLLRECLSLALRARILDLRASPYDVSGVNGCENPIRVETVEGKRIMLREQEDLYADALPVRKTMLQAYEKIFANE